MNQPTSWQLVVSAQRRSGRGGLLGPETARRARWWALVLACGHRTERTVRYKPLGKADRAGAQRRRTEDILPAPKRVKCGECATAAARKVSGNQAAGE
jgi:hypothetical protein